MRSFAGRDILSLKDFERNEFFHLFEIADRLEPPLQVESASRAIELQLRGIARPLSPTQ